MLLLGALLLATVLTLVDTDTPARAGDTELSVRQWTYSLKCHDCVITNTFHCDNIRVCPYETRRCLTLSIQMTNSWEHTPTYFREVKVRGFGYQGGECICRRDDYGGVNPRELLVYKNCTDNCTFVYPALQPPPAPKSVMRTNSFYWVLCCNRMVCNDGGPTNVERDILPIKPIEESIGGAVCLRGSALLLSLASILLSRALWWAGGPPWCPLISPEQSAPP